MAAIVPIPTTRVSDLLATQRLLAQVASDQVDLLRLQTQVATGRRVQFPSEDAPAALRGISLQRLLERKSQVKINLQIGQSYLQATDVSLNNVSNLLAEARATALSVANMVSNPSQREAAARQIEHTLGQLLAVGNQNFRGRYLFAGGKTGVPPFEIVGDYVRYQGNEQELLSFADLGLLFATNAHGANVFGALSRGVEGTADLDPRLTADTLLANLRGGLGINLGSIEINDGANASIVDLRQAVTIGDVVALIESQPPLGRTVSVEATSTGLKISLDPGGGNLTIKDVGGGTTAAELGIRETLGAGTGPITGSDLNPTLTLTTRLDDLLGARATARLASAGPANDLRITARLRGAEFNGVAISFADDPLVTAGNEQVDYDPIAKSLVIRIQGGASTTAQVKAALEGHAGFSADFMVAFDPADANNQGAGLVDVGATATTAGGAGIEFDQQSGLTIANGGKTYTIDLSQAVTVEDLLNRLNGSEASVLAEINAQGTGINVRSRLSGGDFAIGENGGLTATHLGIRSLTGGVRLDSLNHGLGVHTVDGADFAIRRKDGVLLEFDVSGLQTVQDVIDRINGHPLNQNLATQVRARLAAVGNGIELVTSAAAGPGELVVLRLNHSQAAQDLGLIAPGEDRSRPAVSAGGFESVTGNDSAPLEVASVFNALIRLRDALRSNDLVQISRSVELLDASALQINFSRAEIGARQQGLDALQVRLESETIELEAALSNEIDVDLAEAITNLTARQAAFEASLRIAAQIARISLLNFL